MKTIAYKLTSHSKIPVITIRRCEHVSNIDRIVLPLDITFQTREKVPFTAELAKLFHSEILLVSVRLSHLSSIELKLHHYVDSVASYLCHQNISFTIKHLQRDNITDITPDYANSINYVNIKAFVSGSWFLVPGSWILKLIGNINEY